MTGKEIIENWIIRCHADRSGNRVFPNIYIGKFEADILELTKSGYLYEYEVKISRSDFKNDVKKGNKYKLLKHGERVTYFSYIVPEGLISPNEVDDDFGLIYVRLGDVHYHSQEGDYTAIKMFHTVIKKPKKLRQAKATDKEINKLYEKIYWRFHKGREKK